MKPQYALPKLLIAVLLAAWVLPALGAEPSLPAATVADGAIVGIVTNSAKAPGCRRDRNGRESQWRRHSRHDIE